MTFIHEIRVAFHLIILTLWLQCAGLAALIAWVRRAVAGDLHRLGPFRSAVLVVRLTGAVIILHVSVILLWASCYRWLYFPSWESAFYFSASSYATAGYGDVVLPSNWRMLGPLEGIIGMLMCGISVSILFATVTRLVGREVQLSETLQPSSNSSGTGLVCSPRTGRSDLSFQENQKGSDTATAQDAKAIEKS
jgi:voltage-gated potassium channel